VGQPELTRSIGAATVALWCDDLDTARAILDPAGAGVVSLGLIRAHLQGVLAAADGNDAGAEDLAHEALTLAAPERIVPAVIGAIETLAAVHPADALDRALRLAAAAHLPDQIGYRLELPPIRRPLDQLLADARASLGDGFDTVWTEGAHLTWEQAVA